MSKELKDKTIKDLEKMLLEAREDLRKFRFNLSGTGKRDIKDGKSLRKQIAQILTEINNRND
jgi:ribosomal protein L29